MGEEKEKRHKCVNCGCKIFKISYCKSGIIKVLCNNCRAPALVTMITLSSIPASEFAFGEGEE